MDKLIPKITLNNDIVGLASTQHLLIISNASLLQRSSQHPHEKMGKMGVKS